MYAILSVTWYVLLLTLWTQAPKNDLRLLDYESMIGGRFEAGSSADGAVDIGGQAAVAADDVVVIVPHPRFVSSGVAGGLDAPNEAGDLQRMEIVVHGLSGKGAEPLASRVGNSFGIAMLAFAGNGHEDRKTRSRHP
jgi:hypothetical protein